MIPIPHLETDITTACQLSCVACNHHVPLWRAKGPFHADPRQVERDLTHLSTFLHANVWGALGGEPLLSKHLPDILHIVRASGICDTIEVWTNGLRLAVQTESFWNAPFDVIVLSVYPGKHDAASMLQIQNLCEHHGKTLSLRDETTNPNFRTLLESTPTGPVETRRKFERCFFRHFSRVVNNGVFYTCCCAPHMPGLVQGRDFEADGVRVEGLTEEGLRAYLARTEPLGACNLCAGRDTAVPIQWREVREPAAWLAASAGRNE